MLIIGFSCSWKQSFHFDRALYKKYNPTVIGKKTSISENGFFIMQNNTDKDLYTTIVFFSDGIVNFETHNQDSTSYKRYLSKLSSKNTPLKRGLWGYFEIQNDVIIIVLPQPPGGMTNYSTLLKYKIPMEGCIRWIESQTSYGDSNTFLSINTHSCPVFVRIEEHPQYDCWLKQKRWFWADKEAYKAYKKRLKKGGKN